MDKVLAIFHSLVVGAIVARYLGPSGFGILAFATAIYVILKPLVNLGSDKVVTREFVKKSDRADLFWTTFFARIGLGSLAVISVALCMATGAIELSSNAELWVIIITTAPLMFSGFEAANFVLQAELLNKFTVVALNVVLVVASTAKLILVYNEQELVWFAAVNAANTIIVGFSIYLITKRMGLVPPFRLPKRQVFRDLLKECWPLIFAALSVVLYMNVDCMMLRLMIDPHEAGIYAVAVRLSAVWYFVPVVLGTSFFPWLTKTYHDRQHGYMKALNRFFEINALMSYGCVLVALTTFPTVIFYLFGPEYSESISVFRWHIFGIIFVFMGTARSQHLNLAKLHLFNMVSTMIGLVVNVALNIMLIPLYASRGAAIATVASFACAALVTTFLSSELSEVARLQVKSWLVAPFKSYSIVREIVRIR